MDELKENLEVSVCCMCGQVGLWWTEFGRGTISVRESKNISMASLRKYFLSLPPSATFQYLWNVIINFD